MSLRDITPMKGNGGDNGGGRFSLSFLQVGGSLIVVALIIILALWLGSGFYTVAPAERGVIRIFGRFSSEVGPGLHWRWPRPIGVVNAPKVEEIKRIELGFRTIDPGPPARYIDRPEESLMITGDENIVDAEIIVQYKIKNAPNYLFNVRDVIGALGDASEAALRQVIGSKAIDEALTTGKADIQRETKELLQEIMDTYNAGISIVQVQLQDVTPPVEVVPAFKDVASAREDRSRLINEARGYQNDIIPEARGEAEKTIKEAEAYKEEKIKRAQGDADRFNEILAEYGKAKDITEKRLYLETMESILPGVRKFIIDSSASKGSLLQLLDLTSEGAESGKEGR